MKIFVYGTLLQGMPRNFALRHAHFEGLGFITADLYDCGSYPGILPGKSTTYGELYTIDEVLLAELDFIEGYDANDVENSLFLRRYITVTSLHQAINTQAYVYLFNGHLPQEQRIRRGDYRRYLLSKQPTPHWYLAYGSNISSTRLQQRIGDLTSQFVIVLPGFSVVFNKRGANDTAYANLSYDGSAGCPVVAHQVSTAQLATLDCYEGESVDYIRLGMPFFHPQHEQMQLGYIYIAHPSQLTDNLPIADAYLAHIFAGYREQGLDTSTLPQQLDSPE